MCQFLKMAPSFMECNTNTKKQLSFSQVRVKHVTHTVAFVLDVVYSIRCGCSTYNTVQYLDARLRTGWGSPTTKQKNGMQDTKKPNASQEASSWRPGLRNMAKHSSMVTKMAPYMDPQSGFKSQMEPKIEPTSIKSQ